MNKMENEIIFESCFHLNFIDKEIEKCYQDNKGKTISGYIKILTVLLFLICNIGAIINTVFIQYYYNRNFQIVFYTSYILTFSYMIFLLILLFTKYKTPILVINYANYMFLLFICINFRYAITNLANVTSLFFFVLLSMEIILRLLWVILGIQGFQECLTLIILTNCVLWIVFPPTWDRNMVINSILGTVSYTIALFIVTCFAYLLERQQKKAFYFHYITDTKAKWLSSVFENMKSGFLSINRGQITYINSYFLNKLEKTKIVPEDKNINTNLETRLIIENKNTSRLHYKDAVPFFENILKHINTDSIRDSIIVENMINFKNKISNCENNIISEFTEYISKVPGIDDFVLIGDFFLELIGEDCQEIYFEFFCRYIKSDKNGYELECLFNDVTRTKLNEKQNLEFTYRTLFLSKVAHEFKNPLICISELINQFDDIRLGKIRNLDTDNELIKTLLQIKSMSNFLLVLVKDLDYFSQSQLGKNIALEARETSVSELLSFCEQIARSLLQKHNREDEVMFHIKRLDKIPERIITDEWRLKQVLVNLISNAVKFTFFGEIALEISIVNKEENNLIKFLIRDSGIGIKEEEKVKIFKPFSKGNLKNNELGAGLGLSIVSDISTQLGERVKFISELGKGSSFWVSIPLITKQFETVEIKDISLKNEDYVEKNKKDINMLTYLDTDSDKLNSSLSNSNERTVILDYTMNKTNVNYLTKYLMSARSASQTNFSTDIIQPVNNNQYNIFNQKLSIEMKSFQLNKKRTTSSTLYCINDFVQKEIISLRKKLTNEEESVDNEQITLKKTKPLNIIVVDDEFLTRKSVVRIIKMIASEINMKINIIEAQDGIECIFLVYKCVTQGIKISMIFSDETMNFMNGSISSEIIHKILHEKNFSTIPFYLVTALSNIKSLNLKCNIEQILSKPLNKDVAKELINSIISRNYNNN